MSQISQQGPPGAAPPIRSLDDSEGDPLLFDVVNGYTNGDQELRLTLMVGGTLVSGTLISYRTYRLAVHGSNTYANALPSTSPAADDDEPDTANGQDAAGHYVNVVPDPAGHYMNVLPDPTDNQDPSGHYMNVLPDPPTRHVHLKNAVLMGGGTGSAGGFWRVRIRAVDAWTIDSIASTENSQHQNPSKPAPKL